MNPESSAGAARSADVSSTAPLGEVAATGIPGLDHVLSGGLPRSRLYLVHGQPGVGKTTLAMQFLLEGARQGERVLYVTLSETREELEVVARSHGWSLDGIDLFELGSAEQIMNLEERQTVFHPAEVELNQATESLLRAFDERQPSRAVLDSLSELRLLAGETLRYRREVLRLKVFFAGRACTVLMLDDETTTARDQQLDSVAHGVLEMERQSPEFGADRRRLRVKKIRGWQYREGNHDFKIRTGGIEVYPRLVAAETREGRELQRVGTGIPELDAMLRGGLDEGSSTLLMGPSGVGKSTVALRCALTAAQGGTRVVVYTFDEDVSMIFARCRTLGLTLEKAVAANQVRLQQIDPAELTPGEFSHVVTRAVEEDGVRMILIDSLSGYVQAMPEEGGLSLVLHELLRYLSQHDTTSLIVAGQHGAFSEQPSAGFDVSYLADTVLLLRYYEHRGAVRRALSVFKRRAGDHETTLRDLQIGPPDGIALGAPLDKLYNVLQGIPVYEAGGTVSEE